MKAVPSQHRIAVALAVAGLSAASIQGTEARQAAAIPVGFYVGDAFLPAGRYLVSAFNPAVFTFRKAGDDDAPPVFIAMPAYLRAGTGEAPHVTLRTSGAAARWYVSEVYLAGSARVQGRSSRQSQQESPGPKDVLMVPLR
jgi:hypothetical protein